MQSKKIDLKAEFEKGQEELGAIADQFPWEDETAYAYWLAQTYCYVTKSTRILALAAAYFPEEQNKFHYRFLDHAREEKGHEKLLTNDLKTLGWKAEDIAELPEMSAFYQCLYYWIEHIHPIGLFGWVLCLEGLAVKKGPQLFDRVKKAFGDKAISFWKVHSNEDIGHLAAAFEVMEALTEEEKALIIQNFKQCNALYGSVLTRIQTICTKKTQPSRSTA